MKVLDHLSRRVETALFEHGPKAASALVRLSTLYAQLRLWRKPPVRALVDNTVVFHAITHETAWVPTGRGNWGAHQVETGYSARIPVREADTNSREYQSVKYLPGIAHLARVGLLTLMTSGELWVERMYQPLGRFSGYGYFDLDLFKDIEMPLVDKIPDMHFGASGTRSPKLEELRDARLAHSPDPLYRALVRELGPRNSQDAWHIRTAEARCSTRRRYHISVGSRSFRIQVGLRCTASKHHLRSIWKPDLHLVQPFLVSGELPWRSAQLGRRDRCTPTGHGLGR